MIDLHLHILPGVDDGAANGAVAASMLQEARRQGHTSLVATPHLIESLSEGYYTQVRTALDTLIPIAARIGIELSAGFEVMLMPDLPRRLERGEPITLGSSMAVLVELPMTVWPTYTESTLFDMQTLGYRPVLAHPERYVSLQRDPARALRLAEQGVILQVTTSAVAGLFGKAMQRLAERWIQDGVVHLLASDAHSVGRRMTEVPRALERVAQLVGPAEVRRLTYDAPRAVLNDAPIPLPLIEAPRQAGNRFFSWLRRL